MTLYIEKEIKFNRKEPECDSELIAMLNIDEEKYNSARLSKSNKRAIGRIVTEYGLEGLRDLHKQQLLKYRGCGELFLEKLEFMGLWKMPPKKKPLTKDERLVRNHEKKRSNLLGKINRASLQIKKWEKQLHQLNIIKTMSTQETINAVREWGIDKGIIGPQGKATEHTQYMKLREEVAELCTAIGDNDRDDKIDAIGDCAVVLILLADIIGVSFEECLSIAYHVIKSRTGQMIDGVFVKDK